MRTARTASPRTAPQTAATARRASAARAPTARDLMVEIADPQRLSRNERAAIFDNCRRANLSLYRLPAGGEDRDLLARLWRQLGLRDLVVNPCAGEDGMTRIEFVPAARYIPYTRRALNWHTDGYYYPARDTVRGVAMHCARPARRGGGHRYFDPETAWALLHAENPQYTEALSHPATLTIPANLEDGAQRAACSRPVFARNAATGHLHMCWTERARNIRWRDDPLTQAALASLRAILNDSGRHIACALAAGEGVVCNNVLHRRDAFEDDPAQPRLLYRGRYRDRVGAEAPC